MLKRLVMAITLGLLILSVVDRSNAQDDVIMLSLFASTAELNNYSSALMADIQTRLKTDEVDIQVVDIMSTTPATVSLLMTQADDGRIRVEVVPGRVSFEFLPLLYAHRERPFYIFIPTQEHEDAVIDDPAETLLSDWIVGVTLYTVNRCDLAEPYFAEAGTAFEHSTIESDLDLSAYFAFYRGNCAILKNDFDSAVKFYSEALDISAPVSQLDFAVNITWAYMQIDQADYGFELLGKIIDNGDGERTKVYLLEQRAQLYLLASQPDKGLEDLNAAVEIATRSELAQYLFNNYDLTVLFTLRGKMYLAQYEWDSALADYNQAIELDPAYADAYYERGVLYYSILQTGVELRADALADFQHYLELAPDGDHAEAAARYAEQIEKELEALNG